MAFDEADRRAVASVATQFFVNGAVVASFIPRLPEIRDRVDVSTDVLGGLLTVAGVAGLVGSAVSSRLIERLGTRRTLIGGAIILLLGLPIIGFATVPVVLVIGLAIISALDVIVDVSMNLQGSWLSARRHAPIMNRLHGLWSLGTVVGGLVAAQVTSLGVSLQTHLLAVAVILAFTVAFVGSGLLRVDEHVGGPDDDPAASTISTRQWSMVALGVAGAFAVAVEVTSSDWAAFRLRDDFATSAGFAGLGFVAFTVGMTAGRFGGDFGLQRLGPDRLALASIAAAGAGLAAAAFVPNRFVVIAGYVIAGAGVATFFPRLYDEAAQHRGARGAGLAALTAGSRLASLAVPAIVGGLAATSLSVGSATAIIVLPSVVGFAVLMLRPRRATPAP